jgi:hypothetical protein
MKNDIAEYLKRAAQLALKSDPAGFERMLNALGLLAQNNIRAKIAEGIPPPLALSTILGRLKASTGIAGARAELRRRMGGAPPSMDLAKPLIATGQLRNSITYVIRLWVSGRDLQAGSEGSAAKWNRQFGG